jgi:hypothetical protein
MSVGLRSGLNVRPLVRLANAARIAFRFPRIAVGALLLRSGHNRRLCFANIRSA